MPRRKLLSDEAVLAGAMRVMGRTGPDAFTLAAVSAETGIAPATLVQRFGDKQGLILRAVEQDNAALFRTLATAPAKPGAASVIALFRILTPPPDAEAGLPDQFLWLRLDMRDPALNTLARARFTALRKAIELATEACRLLGLSRQRVAVCGLNPHAGDGGAIGNEDKERIVPAVRIQRIRTGGGIPLALEDSWLPAGRLPSSSGALTMSFAEKLAAWRVVG